MTSVSSQVTAPDAYRRLVWDTFFACRGRGKSVAEHFPWLQVPDPTTWYVTLSSGNDNDDIVGGLAVRGLKPCHADRNAQLAAIGLVCIHPSYKGQGWSQVLLNRAVLDAKSRGISALLLWTNKPQVYCRIGFAVADSALFGWIEKPVQREAQQRKGYRQPWPPSTSSKRRQHGLPPFALEGHRWFSEARNATLTTLEDSIGTIVAEWSGSPSDVANLMQVALPPRCRMNAIRGDALLHELSVQGWRCLLESSSLQMILPLLGDRTASDWAEQVRVRVLNRI